LSNSNLSKLVESCRFLLQNYPESEECQTYLNSRLNKESQELFQFGYFPNVVNIKSLATLVGEDLLKDEYLLFTKEVEDTLHRREFNFCYFEDYPLIMPFRDVYGNARGIVGRTLLSDNEREIKEIPKYKNTKNFNKSKHLFGLFENKKNILEKGCVFLVEGQFDVIKAVENGFNNIVAIGSCSLSSYQFSLILRYTNNIFLLLDNDEAGRKGRKRIMDRFGALANIQNLYLPDKYKDIDEYYSKNPGMDIEFVFEK
jgi:DNA primase catalytic core